MRLNEAVYSFEQIEFLLSMVEPSIYVIVKGGDDLTDLVDGRQALQKLASLATTEGPLQNKLLLDVDHSWLNRLVRPLKQPRKEKRSVEPELWRNVVLPSNYLTPSITVISSMGVAALGLSTVLLQL